MNLFEVIKYSTFIFWLLYFIEIMYYRIAVLESCELNRKRYLNHINKNLFTSINIKEIILFFIFIIFLNYKNDTVIQMFFAVSYLYLLMDFFQSLAYDCKKIKHKSLMVQTVILIVFIISYYIISNNLAMTYILMFMISILNSFVMFLFNEIIHLFKRRKIDTVK